MITQALPKSSFNSSSVSVMFLHVKGKLTWVLWEAEIMSLLLHCVVQIQSQRAWIKTFFQTTAGKLFWPKQLKKKGNGFQHFPKNAFWVTFSWEYCKPVYPRRKIWEIQQTFSGKESSSDSHCCSEQALEQYTKCSLSIRQHDYVLQNI